MTVLFMYRSDRATKVSSYSLCTSYRYGQLRLGIDDWGQLSVCVFVQVESNRLGDSGLVG